MKGSWHIIACSVLFAILSVILNNNLFILQFIWLLYLFYNDRIQLRTLLLSFILFFFFLHYLPQISQDDFDFALGDHEQSFYGKIVKAPVITEDRIEIVLHVENDHQLSVVYFPNDGEVDQDWIDQLRVGASCIMDGKIDHPNIARNPGEFDFQQYLRSNGISAQITLQDYDSIMCEGSYFISPFYKFRYYLIEKANVKLSDYTATWLKALVLGDKSEMKDSTIDLFQRWGLSHLLAISGLHVAIVIGVIYFVLIKFSLITKEKAEWIIFLFLPIYAFLAGGDPPVLRASMMAMLLILARRFRFTLHTLDVLSVVFLLLLLINPYIIYHIGFQFSFIVAFSIILSRNWLGSVQSKLFQAFIISFISQMVILPLQLHYFQFVQPLSIPLNVLIVPFFSIFVIPSLFFLVSFSFLPVSILQSIDITFHYIHSTVIQFIERVDEWFHYPLVIGDLPTWVFIFYYLFLLLALYLLEKRQVKQAFISFTCSILVILGFASLPYFSPKGSVTMLDIGQGDAFIIELPYRQGVIMIDAGARFSFEDMEATDSVYRQIIKPYLYTKGISKIDLLFLTHEDIDHDGSTTFMIRDRIVETIAVSNYYIPSDELLQKEEKNQISVFTLEAGENLMVRGQEFFVLGPVEDKEKANENSLVLYTELGGKNWLFTGDIGIEEEKELIERQSLEVDVLKVAHHGSNTSTDPEFIKELSPRYALIPVGENNMYGHPTSEVITTLENEEVLILRSDVHGAIQYKFEKESVGDFHIFLTDF